MKKTLVITLLSLMAIFAAACSNSGVNNGNNTNANKTTEGTPAPDHSHKPGTAPHNDSAAPSKPHNDNKPAPKQSPDYHKAP